MEELHLLLGRFLMCDMQVHTLCGFSEGLQQAYDKAKSKEKFLKDLRKLVKDEIMEILASRKVSTIALVKYENDKIKVTKKGKIKTTKIGYFFDCKKIV